jgi:hypothetical protein
MTRNSMTRSSTSQKPTLTFLPFFMIRLPLPAAHRGQIPENNKTVHYIMGSAGSKNFHDDPKIPDLNMQKRQA